MEARAETDKGWTKCWKPGGCVIHGVMPRKLFKEDEVINGVNTNDN